MSRNLLRPDRSLIKSSLLPGVTFSPDGKYAYVSDTGINKGFFGYNFSDPASM